MSMKGIKIGIIVKKKCGGGKIQKDKVKENIYVNDPEAHKKFIDNIFSIFT